MNSNIDIYITIYNIALSNTYGKQNSITNESQAETFLSENPSLQTSDIPSATDELRIRSLKKIQLNGITVKRRLNASPPGIQ